MFVFVRVHINDEVFLVQIEMFLEQFRSLISLVSYPDVYNSELHQGMYNS